MINEALANTEQKMMAAVEGLNIDLRSIRGGRASPTLVERLKVDYAGAPTPLNQLATITAPEARLLVIQPWDKGIIGNINKAILKSDLGLNPSSDSNVIRLAIPPLNEERRQELIKIVRKRVEERKVSIRNIRHDAVNNLKKSLKNKDITEDEHKRTLAKVQLITDKMITDIDNIGQQKEAELKEI